MKERVKNVCRGIPPRCYSRNVELTYSESEHGTVGGCAEKPEGGITKGHKETFGGDGSGHYFDSGGGFHEHAYLPGRIRFFV